MKRRRRICGPPIGGLFVVVGLAVTATVAASDDEPARFYLGLRGGAQLFTDAGRGGRLDATNPNEVYGLSFGVDVGRHFGIELAFDHFEPKLHLSGVGTIGEYGIGTLIPEARLRLPILDGHATVYALAGIGVSFADFNDRKPVAFDRRIRARDVAVAGAVGGGIEYFIASNLAVGLESRLILTGAHDIDVDGERHRASLDSFVTTAGVRIFFSGPQGPGPSAAPAGPFYIGVRAGGALPLHRELGGGLKLRPESAAIGDVDYAFGATIGADLGRFVAVELSGDSFEPNLAFERLGSVAEYAIYAIVPQVRLRYPLLGDRLVPYALGGVGFTYAEVNDVKPPGRTLRPQGRGLAPAGAVGAGIDYMVADNLAVGVGTKYVVSAGQRISIGGNTHDVDVDALITSVGLRVLCPWR
jgi:opacity protein-like surface antigen